MPPTKDKTMTDPKQYRLGIYSSRATMDDAINYAHQLALSTDSPAAVLTAVHVVLNTAIDLMTHQPEPLTDDERDAYLHAAHQMHQHGGGFAAALAEAYMRADSNNSQILRTSFAHIFNRYMEQAA
jgi:hypothetical protein